MKGVCLMSKFKIFGTIIGIIICIVIFAFVGAWIGLLLWGAIAVAVFGLPALTFWQFLGMMILIYILIPAGKSWVIKNKKE